MKILQIAPLWERVPPPGYGGTEAVVSVLTDALVRAGHDVTLWASGDSLTLAELRSVYPRGLRTAKDVSDATPYEWVHAGAAIAGAKQFDIIHNHAMEPVMALAGLVNVPMLTTMHCLITSDTRVVWQRYSGYYNTISRAQFSTVPPLEKPQHAGVVRNAVDVASFPFSTQKDDYLLCLNRVAPEKGTHLAIEAARRAGRKLIIAGKVDPVDRDYYEAAVKPRVDGRDVVFLGEADQRTKRELYARAACVLMPICWDEPFGLVMVEAMACGTPVIAFARGAAPELIVDGETGFLVNDVDSMLEALGKIDTIEPDCCRQHVEANFDVPVMVEGYLRLYREIVGAPATLAETPPVAPVPAFYANEAKTAGAGAYKGAM
ncbi:MAG: glycosyltransferase family 4 protein [Chloroflexi bacterium]|nr:glycosyltransferase family 4 protein [Chloroflexota bacterium]